MIRILIADDHFIVRQGVKELLALTGDVEVACEAENGDQVMEYLHRASFDLVLLDMDMPGLSGANLINHIRAHDAKVRILVLSMHNEAQIVRSAFKAGASGYLTKHSEPETLLEAIGKVAAGGRFVDPVLDEQVAFEADIADLRRQHRQLSDREFEILRLLVRGKSVNEIAQALAISNKTVSAHKARLMQKMKFRSKADLVFYGIRHGLVE